MLCAQANQILDLRPGEVFVQRNVGNLATHKDMNCMACLEYAVDNLKVKHVMVVGHYNCGACSRGGIDAVLFGVGACKGGCSSLPAFLALWALNHES